MTSNPEDNSGSEADQIADSASGHSPDPDELADLLDRAKIAALREDWPVVRQHIDSALDSLDAGDRSEGDDSWVSRTLASINFLVVAGIAVMIIGGTLWFRAGIGLEQISDDIRVIETFTNDANRMKTILSLEDDRLPRQIAQAVGIGVVIAGALVTVYAYTRPRR